MAAVVTASERPAGWPACGAHPAGAHETATHRAPGSNITPPRHGTARAIRWHNATRTPRCSACRHFAAGQRAEQRKRAYLRRGRKLLVDSCGVRRRLQALSAIGWSKEVLAAELGCHRANLQHIQKSKQSTPATAAAVEALYDRLSMIPGPNPQAAAWAARQGWPPPLAWDDQSIDDPTARPIWGGTRPAGPAFDEVAVQRAMHGDPVPLRPPERAEAVRRLTGRGFTAAQIAERLHTTTRSVVRHRGRLDPARRSA